MGPPVLGGTLVGWSLSKALPPPRAGEGVRIAQITHGDCRQHVESSGPEVGAVDQVRGDGGGAGSGRSGGGAVRGGGVACQVTLKLEVLGGELDFAVYGHYVHLNDTKVLFNIL